MKRYGRQQKRKHKAQIEQLQKRVEELETIHLDMETTDIFDTEWYKDYCGTMRKYLKPKTTVKL